MFEHALPVLLALAVLAGGCLLLAWRLRRPDHYGPPLARGFLRGGRFRGGSRDELRGQLYRLSARASKAGDEEAARLLDNAALALNSAGQIAFSFSVPAADLIMTREYARAGADGEPVYPDATLAELAKRGDSAAGAELARRQSIAPDLRAVDRRELERRNRAAATVAEFRAQTDRLTAQVAAMLPRESPVFRGGRLVGYLRGHETTSMSVSFHEGVTVRKERGAWTTEAPDNLLVALPPNVFRLAILLLFLAFGWVVSAAASPPPPPLLPPMPPPPIAVFRSARAADLPTYQAAQLSQYQHKALALKPGELVCAVGFVESVRHERDGDYHVWVCSDPAEGHWTMAQRRGSCVLGEIVPPAPLPRPAKGLSVKMCGRWIEEDLEHKWTELHPVAGWCSPGTSCEVLP